ncbi:MAG: bifunctional demethylmenaquinone methyltransferase/2-methoxy-6-polyprenyl-1,4-benzoquinol methylase UbiE [Chlorobiaceae bacterium]|nr:bifunctional demethylmenaquinone methyltransferase/2-methoxy-6-polyprenyl-1,4-benzoquinol methylase UbiE [Chlorobiaceae bacterium]MBA4309226.1 bifunctional demethylmenaquinone methyltransferase/2-methoxy-6-polyprenyl-1,4-benzoquinol methylase UbiE [Chlorobiaceae bacterium]
MMNKKEQVRMMFDSIAYRYDLLNHLLSAGIDIYWRKKALKLSEIKSNDVLLDIACGTGDFAIESKRMGVQNIFAADFSFNMLTLFNKKSKWISGRNVRLVAEILPFKPNVFSKITVAFGVRNFYEIQTAFNSFYDVLRKDGKVIVLEFSMPKNIILKFIYRSYFKHILPIIGKIISKDKSAYTYLPDSVEEFDKNVDLEKIFYQAKFRSVEKHLLTFGLVQVVIATK